MHSYRPASSNTMLGCIYSSSSQSLSLSSSLSFASECFKKAIAIDFFREINASFNIGLEYYYSKNYDAAQQLFIALCDVII